MVDTQNNKPSALTFPCDFVIKVFGAASEQFTQQITDVVRQHQTNLPDNAIVSRPSKDGKYLALSITVHVESQKELDDIYRALSSHPLVLTTL